MSLSYPLEIEEHFDDGTLDSYLGKIAEGKEASIHLCAKRVHETQRMYAVKLYKYREKRSFKNRADYFLPITLLSHRREARAIKNKTKTGRRLEESLWMGREWETLMLLAQLKADTPSFIKKGSRSIVMEYIGDENGPAPKLIEARNEIHNPKDIFEIILGNIILFLHHNIVHADLSPYNILYDKGRVVIIDFPQVVDPRNNLNARSLLERDLIRICNFFKNLGVDADPSVLLGELWGDYEKGIYFPSELVA
jgi:RIO kinase 1